MKKQIPAHILKERFLYDPETGVIRHKTSGKEAGSVNKDGYRALKVIVGGRRIQVMAHIACWVIFYGDYPEADIDHRDTVRDNNKILNLRDASRSNNLANRNKIGALPKGVTVDKDNKTRPYRAQLKNRKKNYYLGHFACPHEAGGAYLLKAREVYGEFTRV